MPKTPLPLFRISHAYIFTVLLLVCFALALKDLVTDAWVANAHSRTWKRDFDVGISLWDLGDNHSKTLIESALKKSVAEKAPIEQQISARRDFAKKLYSAHEWAEGDQQLDKAIALCTTAKPEGAEADQLSHAFQDRGWSAHLRYLKDPNLPTGEREQERSYEVSRDAFGAQSAAAIYKLATLGLINVDSGDHEKGNSILDQAKSAVDTVEAARPAGWFVYELLAQAKVLENDPEGAAAARAKAMTLTSDKTQLERITRDYNAAIKRAGEKQ